MNKWLFDKMQQAVVDFNTAVCEAGGQTPEDFEPLVLPIQEHYAKGLALVIGAIAASHMGNEGSATYHGDLHGMVVPDEVETKLYEFLDMCRLID